MKFGKKGQIEIILGAAILGGLIVGIPFLAFVFKFHYTNVIVFENNYNTADLAMLSLLSMKNDGQEVPQILAEHLALSNPSDISFTKKILDETVQSKCYKLTAGTLTATVTATTTTTPSYVSPASVIQQSTPSDCTPDTASETKLVLPYNPNRLTVDLELSVS